MGALHTAPSGYKRQAAIITARHVETVRPSLAEYQNNNTSDRRLPVFGKTAEALGNDLRFIWMQYLKVARRYEGLHDIE